MRLADPYYKAMVKHNESTLRILLSLFTRTDVEDYDGSYLGKSQVEQSVNETVSHPDPVSKTNSF